MLPAGWAFVPGFGVRQQTTDPRQIAANIALGEDRLPNVDGLTEYIAAQAALIMSQIPNARIAGPQPSSFPGAEQAFLFMVRHNPDGLADMLHVQSYVRVGLWVGIVTLTTVESFLKQVRPDYDGFLKGLHILPETPAN